MSARYFIFLSLFAFTGCAELYTGRSYLSEMERDDSSFFNPREDFPIVAGDSGRDWMSESERRQRTPASAQDLSENMASRALKSELRTLEGMQTEESFEMYQTHLKSLPTVSDRIYFLKLPQNERRDYLISRGAIEETKRPTFADYTQRRPGGSSSDVLLGMNKQDVLASLGKPTRVEVAGNPRNENERWLYRMNGYQKYIYFESGRVEGWE